MLAVIDDDEAGSVEYYCVVVELQPNNTEADAMPWRVRPVRHEV